VIDAAVGMAMAAAPRPHPPVHVAVDPTTGPVLGDRAHLEQIVCNLLSNALKFTPPDGRVDVRLEHDGTTIRIVVADTGWGIPRETLPHLFDEFWQGSAPGEGSPVGLGLGLAIVRHLVDRHGGTVGADSAGPGCGAVFVVAFPLAGEGDRPHGALVGGEEAPPPVPELLTRGDRSKGAEA